MTTLDRRTELLGWIAQTKQLQRKLAYVFGALAIVALGLALWRGPIGAFAFVCVGLIAIVSFWVTESHNAAHRQKLDEIARIERNAGKPVQTAHRRWHAPQ